MAGQAVILLIPYWSNHSALVDGQVRAYGFVTILAASALVIYETTTQAAVAVRRR